MYRHAGYGCIRLAASGGGFDDDLPDLFFGTPTYLGCLEAKYRTDKDKWHYSPLEEKEQLQAFAEMWGCDDALWAVRFPQDTSWYFLPVEMMETTEQSVKWRYDDVKDDWVHMDYFDLVPHSDVPDDFR